MAILIVKRKMHVGESYYKEEKEKEAKNRGK